MMLRWWVWVGSGGLVVGCGDDVPPPAAEVEDIVIDEALPVGQVDEPYDATVQVTGGLAPFTTEVVGFDFAGLSIDETSLRVTGTPTEWGDTVFTVVVEDARGVRTRGRISLEVAEPPPLAASCGDQVGERSRSTQMA